ncbi:MAG: type III pantothenate kinase [Chloroflexi bacterium]|nr:type III pantothenate kinase [Chloroflexota bacterium]
MLLAVDVGNTNVKLGVYDERRLVASWRLTTRREQTADEYGVFTHTMLRSHGVEPPQVTDIAVSSTVPAVQRTMEEMARRYFGLAAFVVDPGVNVTLSMRVDYPREVGPDRVVKVVAGVELYGPPLIIIDFGTATTFECVSPLGEFIGGAIAPGIATSAEALTARAARLFRVDLSRPPTAIGRNTVTNIQSGIVYGYAGLVDGLVARMRAEMDGTPKVVATGGLVHLMDGLARTIDVVNPHLTLEGLRIACARAQAARPGSAGGGPAA